MSGPFTGLNNAMLDRLLDCSPRAVKIALAMGRRHNGANNGSIPFSVREAAAAISSTSRLARDALDELQHNGLIECTKPASFDFKVGAAGRQARRWKLNFLWERRR